MKTNKVRLNWSRLNLCILSVIQDQRPWTAAQVRERILADYPEYSSANSSEPLLNASRMGAGIRKCIEQKLILREDHWSYHISAQGIRHLSQNNIGNLPVLEESPEPGSIPENSIECSFFGIRRLLQARNASQIQIHDLVAAFLAQGIPQANVLSCLRGALQRGALMLVDDRQAVRMTDLGRSISPEEYAAIPLTPSAPIQRATAIGQITLTDSWDRCTVPTFVWWEDHVGAKRIRRVFACAPGMSWHQEVIKRAHNQEGLTRLPLPCIMPISFRIGSKVHVWEEGNECPLPVIEFMQKRNPEDPLPIV